MGDDAAQPGAAELEERARRLEQEHDGDARRAAAAGRVRTARELHDAVAHHVSVIVLQSQASEVPCRTRLGVSPC